ncbi:hypothetical protein [Pontibacter rugosus]
MQIRLYCGPPSERPKPPVVLVNNQETAMDALILEIDNIASIDVVKKEQHLKQLSERAPNGVILIKLKKDKPMVRLAELYDVFDVPKEQQNLSIAINGAHVEHPELLLADQRKVDSIVLASFDDVDTLTRWSFEDTYLNIILKPKR